MNVKLSAEQAALKDISKYVESEAKGITELYDSNKELSSYGFWDNNVTIVISRMYISAKALCTKENRKLNKQILTVY